MTYCSGDSILNSNIVNKYCNILWNLIAEIKSKICNRNQENKNITETNKICHLSNITINKIQVKEKCPLFVIKYNSIKEVTAFYWNNL